MYRPRERRHSATTEYDTLLERFTIGEILEVELDPGDHWPTIRAELIAAAQRLRRFIQCGPYDPQRRLVDCVLCPRGWRWTFLDNIRRGETLEVSAERAGLPPGLPAILREWNPPFAAAWDGAAAAAPVALATHTDVPPSVEAARAPAVADDAMLDDLGPGDIGEVILLPGECQHTAEQTLQASADRRGLRLHFFAAAQRRYVRIGLT